MMEKNGMLSDKSHCDFDQVKKAEYFDAESEAVASEEHKAKLVKPIKIKDE